VCHACKQQLRVVPIFLLHDQEEVKRFHAMFEEQELSATN